MRTQLRSPLPVLRERARQCLTNAFSPSPGTPGEGRGEGLLPVFSQNPHPRPLPEYREREYIARIPIRETRPRVRVFAI